jgi:ABC-2 type transport system permease protein
MTGFRPFMRKELLEIRRTWRLWVIPGMLVFLGLTSPIIAAVTPALVRSMTAAQPGVVVKLPTPTSLDAFAQFLKNLNQFVLLAVIIAGAGAVSGERASGTAILMLTKPLSRSAFVVAKIVSQVILLVASTVLGTVACVLVTAAVFTEGDNARLLMAVALWLLFASLLIVVMTLFSAAFRTRGAAAGAGLGFFFCTLLFSSWAPAAHYTFAGLLPAMGHALTGQRQLVPLGWPLGMALAAIVIGAFAAVRTFERQEL